jgi:uncharacterized LabA/DUF88 family protein
MFIDGGPFFDGLRGQGFSADIDFIGLGRLLAPASNIVDRFFYMAPIPDPPYPVKKRNQERLFQRLRDQGFIVRLGHTQVSGGVFIERGVEALLAVDLLNGACADSYDSALLISRRADFIPAVEAVKQVNKKVETAFFRYTIDSDDRLASASDSATVITHGQILMLTRSGPRPFKVKMD